MEQLLGRRVRDAGGHVVGRIEEMIVELVDGEAVVTESHLGGAGLLERIGGFALQLPFLRLLPFTHDVLHIPWQLMDLSEPRHPRTRRANAHDKMSEPI